MIDPNLVSLIDDLLIKGFDTERINMELGQLGYLQQNINDSINYLSNAKRNPPISQYGPPQIPKKPKNKSFLIGILLIILICFGTFLLYYFLK